MNDLELFEYEYEGAKLRGRLALPDGPGPHPAILVMYHALGFDPFVFERCRLLAKLGYTALATDMYGITTEEQAAGKGVALFQEMQKDPQLLRGRVLAGYEAIRNHPAVDKTRIGAMGYCFGGQCVLDLARSGADVKAVVSFHGLLTTGLPAKKGEVKAKVLAITGALDPHVPFAGVPTFQQEMIDADADWNMTIYGKGWHAFTDEAVGKRTDIPGLRYDALLDKMSWAEATALLDHVLQPKGATTAEREEVEAIKALKARYFRYMDTKQWDQWRKVFTDDVVVRVDATVSKPGEDAVVSPLPEGGDAFVANIKAYLSEVSTVHHGHMPEITLTGPDTATGIWSMEDIVGYPDGRVMKGYGHYHEQYRKVDGAWRIAGLRLTRLRLDYTGPWPEGVA